MSDAKNPLRNPADPLHKAGPPSGRELFKRFGSVADGFPHDAVLDAAVNLIINTLRQSHATWADAERAYDELFGRTKTILRDHYDPLGKRRNVFPFDQFINMDHVDFRDKH